MTEGARVPKLRFQGFNAPWVHKTIRELGEVVTGSTPSTSNDEYYSKTSGMPWVTPTDISSPITYSTERHLSSHGQLVARIVPSGSILVTCIASIGKNTILARDGSFNQQINAVVPIPSSYDSYFLLSQSYFWSKEMKRTAAAGTMQIVNRSDFSAIPSLVPTLSEQKAIGNLFKQIDLLVLLSTQKHQKLVELKQAMLEKMFPREGETVPELRFPGFTDPWKQTCLGEILHFINGRAFSQTELFSEGKYPVLRVGNLYTNSSWYYSDLELPEKYYVNQGDLIYTWSATFGPHIWTGEKAIYHYHIWKIILSNSVNLHFVLHLLNQDKEKIISDHNGSTMVHITKEGIELRTSSIPSLKEQKAIGQFFTALDDRIAKMSRRVDKLKQLKQALLEKMFV